MDLDNILYNFNDQEPNIKKWVTDLAQNFGSEFRKDLRSLLYKYNKLCTKSAATDSI